jgi:hypothetical protein
MGSSEAHVRLHVFFGRRKLYTLLPVAARHRNEGGETAGLAAPSDAVWDTGLAEMETVPVGQEET